MNYFATKIWRGSPLRPSRFHDEKGHYAFKHASDFADFVFAASTAVLRKTIGYRPTVPWIASNAFRFLQREVRSDAAVFEWGCGMSTLWYERHFREVHAVEDDFDWFTVVSRKVRRARVYHQSQDQFVRKILDFPPSYFDLVVIDGSQRHACFHTLGDRLKPGGILVVDNTDKDRTTKGDLWLIDQELANLSGGRVRRFTGWSPCNLFPQETTVIFGNPQAPNIVDSAPTPSSFQRFAGR